MPNDLEASIIGCLLGTAVGDAMGLPYEGLSADRLARMAQRPEERGLLFGWRLCSDDTEHACMVAQALLVSAGEPDAFVKSLAWRLRFWLMGAPAGIGLATLRGIVRLWLGFPWRRSGVFSAGNGPAMRSAILGVTYGADARALDLLVERCSRMTHSDPKAMYAAHAVALAAYASANGMSRPDAYRELLGARLGSDAKELVALIEKACLSAEAGASTKEFARELGLERGVTGYAYHTVPVAIHAWLRHPADYRSAVMSVIACGGDTDTTAAIAGGIVGAGIGPTGIPRAWTDSLVEWPRSTTWLAELGRRLGEATRTRRPAPALRLNIPALALRNLCFLVIVLSIGFRRLLPPY